MLTPERREQLKALPPWFLARIREAFAGLKEAQDALTAEQERATKFDLLASGWEAGLEEEHQRRMQAQKDREDQERQEVEKWKGEERKRQGAIYRVVDDQVDAKKLELSQAEGMLVKRREQLQTLRRQIEDLQESTRLKQEQLVALEQQKAPKTVRTRLESTARKRLASTHAGIPATMPSPPLPRDAVAVQPSMDDSPSSNTPDTALHISQIDMDCVPAHSVYDSIEDVCCRILHYLGYSHPFAIDTKILLFLLRISYYYTQNSAS